MIFRMASVMIILGLLFAVQPVAAGPLPQGCEGLLNAGFEDGFTTRGANEVGVANGWNPWWQDGPFQADGYNRRPEYKPEDIYRFGRRRIHSGSYAQKFFTTYATHNAGFWQQVNVPSGSKCTFSIWVQVWSSQEPDPDTVVQPGNYRVYVGIDPTGGTDWRSPSVVWSEPKMQYNTWMQLSVTAVAQANKITVYTRGQPEFRVKFNDSYWDDACLTLVRPPSTNTPKPAPTRTPTITRTPTDTPLPTATLTPTITPTPPLAYICIRVHDDSNGNGAQDPGEGLLGGALVSLMNDKKEALQSYTTDGKNEPYCFSTQQQGSYMIQEKNPEGYASTSPDHWMVYVLPGVKLEIGFWDRLLPTPTPSPTPSPTHTPTPSSTPTSTSTETLVPTRTPTAVTIPSPTAEPTPQPILQEVAKTIYGVSGIFVALAGIALIIGSLYLRKRP